QEVLGNQGSNRTEVDHVYGPWVREILAFGLADDGAVTALAHIQYGVVSHVIHKSHASGAKDAAVGHVHDVAAKVLSRIKALWLSKAGFGAAFLVRVVLKLALARLVANGTIERMVDEQHFEHTFARFACLLGVHVHYLSFGHRCGA